MFLWFFISISSETLVFTEPNANNEVLVSAILDNSQTSINFPTDNGQYKVIGISERFPVEQCINVTSVTIPGTYTQIAEGAFSNCQKLKTINVASDNPSYTSSGGILYSKSRDTVVAFPCNSGVTRFQVGNTVTTLENYSIYNATNLQQLILSSSVKQLGSHSIVAPNLEEFHISSCVSLYDTTFNIPVTTVIYENMKCDKSIHENYFPNNPIGATPTPMPEPEPETDQTLSIIISVVVSVVVLAVIIFLIVKFGCKKKKKSSSYSYSYSGSTVEVKL
ncbi:leucine-rich repeat domain-containing protein [Histomonas meleagridis]|uniref:leucine-rich repeat domain-containing protein n=1 Tax=Histomonas meleagridis TaxID=135588 RepID=UPI00355AC0C1|nr:leucine-rich repeat domain-containing protein [Histomonas meleagridis]KAH0800340.1 leucine-rich repeat domain-containing protein [Histomonas meleagridis]